jgi:Ca2+-binding EF-hand superfamily protein
MEVNIMDRKFFGGVLLFLIIIVFLGCAAFQEKKSDLDRRALFQLLDQNKDGRISLEEFQFIWKEKNAAQEAFKALDTNRDGFLSPEELESEFGIGKPGIIIFRW